MLRSSHELSDTFALRQQEFIFLLGRREIDIAGAKDMFDNIFDTDSNKLVDKLEVLCILCLASTLSSELKVEFLFEVFDFDGKGYLSKVELLLLFKIVTAVTCKADKNFPPPSDESLADVLATASRFSERASDTLRKFELVSFAANTPEIRSYLEVWRGQASQVFVVKGQKWQDSSFSASHVSIAPSKEWLSIGLPPEKFITWLRRPRLKPSCEALFGHSEKFIKSVNKNVLDGFGAIANGTLLQGLLASSWLMNAISTLLSNPKVVMGLFQTTAQEFLGRFCVRFYEGGCWNSIFIDDRIPCTPDGVPIFTRSSFSQECWLLLLEKAMAKHLGSYGHLAVAGKRPDAIESALRRLTGGHVTKLYAHDYDWKSVKDEITGNDGTGMILKLLSEGALISFGRSEPLLLNRKTLQRYPSVALPHGRAFPLVGIEIISNFKCLVLKDTFGLQKVRNEGDGEADYNTGHCRTFVLKVEDLLAMFDTIFVVRFPDTLRAITSTGEPSWITKVRGCQNSDSSDAAVFRLTIRDTSQNNDASQAPVAPVNNVEPSPEAVQTGENASSSLEAGEVAAIAIKNVKILSPLDCSITVNR